MTRVEKRRKRRFALAGLLSTLILYVAIAGTSSRPQSSVAGGYGRLPVGVGSATRTGVEPTLSRVAGVLTGRRTTVRCWSQPDWKRHTSQLARAWPSVDKLGPWRAYTSTTSLAISLSPEICAELAKLRSRRTPVWRDPSPDALAWSVETLAHEAQHVSGVVTEAEAECYGMQATPRAARLLGRTSAEGRYLAAVYWKHWYALYKPPYSSNDCRNNGALDLNPDSDVWP